MKAAPLLLCCSLLLAGMQATAREHACPDVAHPPAPVCVASPFGLAYADTQDEAERAARAQAGAAARFATYFGEAPAGVLILSSSYDSTAAQEFANTHGLPYALVWLSTSDAQAMTARAMRKARVQPARIRRAIAAMVDGHESTLRHELGHSMYAATFWPNATDVGDGHYGSPAPDWLDEAAAILMESVESQGKLAGEFLHAGKLAPRDTPPLAEFLDMEHPVLTPALARELERHGQKSDSGVQMLVSGNANTLRAASFYGQALLTGMFLIEVSGDPRILAPISSAVAGGSSFSDWLAEAGPRHGLPDNLAALQTAWETWSGTLLDRAQATQ